VRIEVTLDPADAALVMAAFDRVRDDLRALTATNGRVSAEARMRNAAPTGPVPPVALPIGPGRLDGLIAIAERTMAPAPQREATDAANGLVPQVVIHLDQTVFGPDGAREAYLDDGTRVSAETFRRVSCDSTLVAVTTGTDGRVLDVGRKTRAVPVAIRRALWSRDHGCRFPMCSNRRFVHAHHVEHWTHGGPTRLDNLVLLCSFHHRLLHEGGFKVSLAADGAPRFLTARDHEIAYAPDAARAPTAPPAVVDPDVNLCVWDGEPVDYHEVVDAMCVASG
jgi:hypothetical protein